MLFVNKLVVPQQVVNHRGPAAQSLVGITPHRTVYILKNTQLRYRTNRGTLIRGHSCIPYRLEQSNRGVDFDIVAGEIFSQQVVVQVLKIRSNRRCVCRRQSSQLDLFKELV